MCRLIDRDHQRTVMVTLFHNEESAQKWAFTHLICTYLIICCVGDRS